ncbi:MAG: pyridoxal-5-phosphate-dependent protein subunit beta [Rhodospirillales bacterium]|nr:pyridoxal-5-phosphate-dependent protein subunit beta [Rhodospirillales bacterium]
MLTDPAYIDPHSGRTWPLSVPRWHGDGADGARVPLMLTPLPGIGREAIVVSERSLWRYRSALPFLPDAPITLGEGCTPLIGGRYQGVPVHFKCEWMNPSGSFKDRGASVMLSLLRSQGIDAVLEDSSGNGGAAVATYAAAGGLRARIMVPASTSPAKTVQARAAGAEITLVPGTRQDCADAALGEADNIFYASHNWHPFFLQGTKTLAYELWEDLGFRAPDNVIVPCGAGSNVLGCGIGFAELLRAGQIEKLPRIFAAQPTNCAPIARAFLNEPDEPARPTIAEGTAIAQPMRLREVLGVLRESAGGAVMLSEAEIAEAALALARNGIYVEPTCAQAASAFGKLIRAGRIDPGETTVVVLTGTGLKDTRRYAELLGIAI